jgi:hypothetical protein
MWPDFMPGDPDRNNKKEWNNFENNQLDDDLFHKPDYRAPIDRFHDDPEKYEEDKWNRERQGLPVIQAQDNTKKDKKDKKDNGTSSTSQKKADQSKDFVAIGFGMELSALLYSINIGFFGGYGTGLGSGGIVITFTSGLSNNLSATGYVSVVNEADNNIFKVTDLTGSGYEWSAGWKVLSITRATPTQTLVPYKITQISFGNGKFNPTGSAVQSRTIVIPTFNFIFGSPFK